MNFSFCCFYLLWFVFDLGQLGKENYIEGKTPNLVRTKEGYLENVKEIGAGNKTGMAITEEAFIPTLYTFPSLSPMYVLL